MNALTKAFGIAGLTLSLSGCLEPTPIPEPNPEDFKDLQGMVTFPVTYDYIRPLYIRDLDGDGKPEFIHYAGNPRWIAEGFNPKAENLLVLETPLVMTPEMREIAGTLLQSQRKLAYLLAQQMYQAQEQAKLSAVSKSR